MPYGKDERWNEEMKVHFQLLTYKATASFRHQLIMMGDKVIPYLVDIIRGDFHKIPYLKDNLKNIEPCRKDVRNSFPNFITNAIWYLGVEGVSWAVPALTKETYHYVFTSWDFDTEDIEDGEIDEYDENSSLYRLFDFHNISLCGKVVKLADNKWVITNEERGYTRTYKYLLFGEDGVLKVYANSPQTGRPYASAVLVALAKIGTDEALDILIEKLPYLVGEYVRNPDFSRKNGYSNKFGGGYFNKISSLFEVFEERGIEKLLEASEHEDVYIRSTAIFLLSKLKTSRAISRFKNGIEDDDKRVRRYSFEGLSKMLDKAELFPHLIHSLKDNDAEVRKTAFEELIKIEDPMIVPELLKLIKHDVPFGRGHCDWNIGDIKRAILNLGEKAMPVLIENLQKGDERTQKVVVGLISSIKGGGDEYGML